MLIKWTMPILCLFLSINSEIITLDSGISGTVEILDTSGCDITYRRRGNVIKMAKRKIDKVIFGMDTVFYEGYVCTPENAVAEDGKKFADTYSSNKVNAIVSKMEEEAFFPKNCRLYYFTEPVNGNEFGESWEEAFKKFERTLISKIKNSEAIDKEKLFRLLNGEYNTNRVLIPLNAGSEQYEDKVAVPNGINSTLGMPGVPGSVRFSWTKRSVKKTAVTVTIIVIDLENRTIVHTGRKKLKRPFGGIDFDTKNAEAYDKAKKRALSTALERLLNGFFSRIRSAGMP